MPLSVYDCPTFLGQKDKYIAGLSLPQLMASVGVGFCWFLVSFLLPYSVMVRLLFVIPVTGVTMTLMFVRISGLGIPMYFLLAVQRLVSRPSYEAEGMVVVWGDEEWLEGERMKAEAKLTGKGRRWLRFGKREARGVAVEAKRAELQAEVDKQVAEGSVALEQWVRDGARSFMRGK